MAVAFRAAGTIAETSSTSLVVPYPAGVVSGDLLVIQYSAATSAVTTTPSGWTLLLGPTSGSDGQGDKFSVFYRVAGASEPSSVTIAKTTSGGGAGIMAAYSGVNTSSPIDASAAANLPSSGSSGTTPSVTTTQTNTMLLRFYWVWVSGSPNITPAGTDTERYDVLFTTNGYKMELADSTQAASGASGTTTATTSAGHFGGRGATVALAPGTAPPAAPASGFLGFM
jgi:hypothetical protein